VNVQVHDRLAGGSAVVDADVETVGQMWLPPFAKWGAGGI